MKLISFLFLALSAVTALAQSPGEFAKRLEGDWKIIKGSNPGSNGKDYSGSVKIASKENGVMAMIWTVNGVAAYAGLGFTDGKIMAAGYSNNSPFGLVIYDAKGDEFVGAWTGSMTKGKIGLETLKSAGEGTGIFKIIKGVTPEGGSYSGEVRMDKKGDVYELTWKIGGERQRGVGIRVGDSLVVGWTPGKDVGVVFYSLKEGLNEMEGSWTGLGSTKLGREALQRK